MMEGWKEYKIKDVCQIVGGYAFKSKDFKKEGDIPIVKIKSLKDRKIDISDSEFVDKSFLGLNEKYHVNYNDYIIALTGSHITLPSSAVGRVSKSNHKIALLLNQRVGKFIVDEKLCSHDFLYYFLNTDSFFHNIGLRAKGAANQANISTGDVGDIKINLPPLPTQHKIASILSAYDDLIENNLQRIKLLEEMAQQTYTEWFVRMKFPGHESVERDEETGLPEGWGEIPIGNLVDFQSGFAFKSSTYIKNGKYKIVTIKNVQDGVFIPVVTDTVKEKPKKSKAYHELKTGDIIMSLTGNVGRVCLVYGDDYLLNQRVAKLSSKKDFYNSFIYCHFRNLHTLKILENISNGAAQQNLSPINTSNQKFIIPNDEFLCDFSKVVQPMIKSISLLNMHNLLLKEARDILLPRLMMGMIEV